MPTSSHQDIDIIDKKADPLCQTDAKRRERIAALHREMDAIHYANNLYWQEMLHSNATKAEFYLRQDRLEGVRSELDLLRK